MSTSDDSPSSGEPAEKTDANLRTLPSAPDDWRDRDAADLAEVLKRRSQANRRRKFMP